MRAQGLRQQSLAGAGRPDQHDVRFLQLDVARPALLVHEDALVVVINRDGELLLRPVLPDDVLIKLLFQLLRLGKLEGMTRPAARACRPRGSSCTPRRTRRRCKLWGSRPAWKSVSRRLPGSCDRTNTVGCRPLRFVSRNNSSRAAHADRAMRLAVPSRFPIILRERTKVAIKYLPLLVCSEAPRSRVM